MENQDSFEYTYSAPEQDEVRRIREKYLPREEQESKLDQLRRLDAGVTKKGTVVSLMVGVISCLIMGTGMSCCLVWTDYFVLGIVIGVLGISGMVLAYPLYAHITQRERERIAPQILKLTEELMQ